MNKTGFYRLLLLLCICIGLNFHSVAQIEEKINEILIAEDLKYAEFGISILNTKGVEIYSRNSEQNLIPASLIKIITNFSALKELGDDYNFETRVGINGEILDDGNLLGDLIIYGNGDPSLASERYQKRMQLKDLNEKIYQLVQKKGITCIDGQIIIDASYYGDDGTVHSWTWDDIGNYYATSTWSVNVHENYYNLYFQLAENINNPPVMIGTYPPQRLLQFDNQLVSGPSNSGDQAYIFGSPYTNKRIVRGSLPIGKRQFRIKGSMPNAPEFLGKEIADYLEEKGVPNSGAIVEFKEAEAMDIELGKFLSPNLQDLVKSANLESINLFCESFTRRMGEGSLNEGIERMKSFMVGADIDTSDITIVDGSGLSFWNHISAKDFAVLIQHLYKEYGDELKDFFPEAGESGTLYYMFRKSPARGKLWAKTGSMNEVMNYAGFTTSKSGNQLAFCIMVNRHKVSNRKIRKLEEQIMEFIYLHG